MTTRLQRNLLAATRTLGFRSALFSLFAVAMALLARYADRYLPQAVPFDVGADAVAGVLGILASSMLAVAIFSLSTLVSALAAATERVTPRARPLLRQDHGSLNALSTFVGTFLFSLVGLIALQTGYYGERGRFVLFLSTMVAVLFVVVTLLRWIDRISGLGGVTETTARLEHAARSALDAFAHPSLGARGDGDAPPGDGVPLRADATGYLQHVDLRALQEAAKALHGRVHVACLPGAFLTPGSVLARVVAGPDGGGDTDDAMERARAAFTIGQTRAFDQDPAYGLLVVSEVASHALSPAINDAGTAIDVIGRLTRLLLAYRPEAGEVRFPDVVLPRLAPGELVHAAFDTLARDGAAHAGVTLRLQEALLALVEEGDAAYAGAVRAVSRDAADLAGRALALPADADAVRAVASRVASGPARATG